MDHSAQFFVQAISNALDVKWEDGKTFHDFPIGDKATRTEFKVKTWGELVEIGGSDKTRSQVVLNAFYAEWGTFIEYVVCIVLFNRLTLLLGVQCASFLMNIMACTRKM